jgi:pyridoxamine 5'-phosphate oxidase
MESDSTSLTLTADALGPDPIAAFVRWFEDAEARHGLPFANAACLSTVDPAGWPEGRIVLLKGVDMEGFRFYTNYRSAKGRSLEANPRAALTFYWGDLERQVRIRGPVERLSEEESDEYFRTRPRGSQIGAWASEQSAVAESREVLEAAAAGIRERFGEDAVPRPPFWGGYLVRPRLIEFWQGRADRLHDRLRFQRRDDGSWSVARLNP